MNDRSIDTVLRQNGYRTTGPRRAVWQALAEIDGHASVEEIASKVAELDPGVNLASVYRSLALFRDLGLARESNLHRDDVSRWEPAHPDEHFHLVCTTCGTVDHHVGTLVREIEHHLTDGHGFQPEAIEIVVRGVCHRCRA